MATASTISLSKSESHRRLLIVLSFLAVYLIWGSTYLAIRWTVETIPPLFAAGTRHLFAGTILFLWARMKGVVITAAEWRASAVVGAFYFLGGHGTLHWAEQIVPSGLTALLIASQPIWIAVLLAFRSSENKLTPFTIAGLVLGLIGVALLIPTDSVSVHSGQLVGTIAILLSTASWAVGVMFSRRLAVPKNPIMASASALLSGSAMLFVVGLIAGEAADISVGRITTKSLLSLTYLVLFGTVVAFTAYTWLMTQCPPTLVSTHTYVNPIVAMFLGWAVASEAIAPRIVLAALVILLAVFLVSRRKMPVRPVVAQQDTA